MDKNTDDFLKGLERTEKRMIQDAEYQAKKFVSSLFNALLEPSPAGTPVVSGFMRSNWRIGLDSFDNSTVGTKKSVTYQPQESSFNALIPFTREESGLFLAAFAGVSSMEIVLEAWR